MPNFEKIPEQEGLVGARLMTDEESRDFEDLSEIVDKKEGEQSKGRKKNNSSTNAASINKEIEKKLRKRGL